MGCLGYQSNYTVTKNKSECDRHSGVLFISALNVSKCVQLYLSLHFQLFARQDSNLRRKLHPYAQEDLLISVN
jgi:hypothetical protein